MIKKLNDGQIKFLIKQERTQSRHAYKDEGDLMFDLIVDLYEKKEIDENLFKTLASAVLLNLTKNMLNDLMSSNLLKKSLNLNSNMESNKVILLSYAKQCYA